MKCSSRPSYTASPVPKNTFPNIAQPSPSCQLSIRFTVTNRWTGNKTWGKFVFCLQDIAQVFSISFLMIQRSHWIFIARPGFWQASWFWDFQEVFWRGLWWTYRTDRNLWIRLAFVAWYQGRRIYFKDTSIFVVPRPTSQQFPWWAVCLGIVSMLCAWWALCICWRGYYWR